MSKFLLLIFKSAFLLSFSREINERFKWFKNQKRKYSINNQLNYYHTRINYNEIFSDEKDDLKLVDIGYFSESINIGQNISTLNFIKQ